MNWNILDPTSPLQSRRLWGALLVVIGFGLEIGGVEFNEEMQESVLNQIPRALEVIGMVWGGIGGFLAGRSPRPF